MKHIDDVLKGALHGLFLNTSLRYTLAMTPTAAMLVNRALREWRLAIRVPGLEPIRGTWFRDTRCSASPHWDDVRLLQPICGEAYYPLSPLMFMVMGDIKPLIDE